MSRIKFSFKLGILFLFLLFAIPFVDSQAGSLVCCCREGNAQQASPLPSTFQCNAGFQPVNVTGANITVPNICTALCSSVQPVASICGNGIIESGEECDDGNILSGDGCSSFCTGEILDICGAPGFKPPVANLTVFPVKGENAFVINFNRVCPADSIGISRCKGSGCSDFKLVNLLGKENSYKDEDESLEWKSDYAYRVVANYVREGSSTPFVVSANLGDLECWDQISSDAFCISEFYYDNFKNYLAVFGYAGVSGRDFSDNFKGQVDAIFNSRFNVAWRCNEMNILNRDFGCAQNELCVSDEQGAKCIKPSVCDSVNPFGLYSSVDSCEGSGAERKFCFFDLSNTSVNSCFKCSQKMSCSDYRTSTACSRDNCGAGQCEWRPVFPDLGVGVCVDSRLSNCALCDKSPSPDSPTLGSFNAIFDRCSPAKASALSTQNRQCFGVKDVQGNFVAKSCNNAVCSDFSEQQCGSPAGGIVLNSDNSVKSKSSDVCNIGVCQFHSTSGCFKNADGTNLSVVPFEDCRFGNAPLNKSCELDYFPPATTIVGVGKKSRFEALSVGIRDVLVRNGPAVNATGRRGYETFLCITNSSSCTDFSKKTNVSRISIKNIELRVGNVLFAQLSEGANNVFFYSKDASSNVEAVKNMSFVACSACSVPEVVGVEIAGGRFIQNKFFTSVKKPAIAITFDEDVVVQDVFLLENFNAIPIFQQTSDFAKVHVFVPTVDLEGGYNFSINVKNRNDLFLDEVYTFGLVVDTSSASFVSSPENNAILKSVKEVNVKINASKQIIVKSIKFIEEIFDDYFLRKVGSEIASQFTALNNKSFSGIVKNLREGRKTVSLIGEDFGGLPVFFEFFFVVANSAPDIILKSPAFGLAHGEVFDLIVETTSDSVCRYLFDIPFAPSNETFNQFPSFLVTNGRFHTVSNFDKLKRNLTPLHVYCKNDFGVSQKSFMLGFDRTNPEIVSAFASPGVVGETLPDSNIYSTVLKATTNELGYCKYSSSSVPFDAMLPFPGYGEEPKNEHLVQINVTEVKQHTYFVVCRDRSGLLSAPKSVSFVVDPVHKLGITFTTPPVANSSDILLALNTGKRAVCYYDNQAFAPGTFANAHTLPVSVGESGVFNFSVECSTPAGEKAEKTLRVLVDLSHPEMLFVNDSTVYSEDPSINIFKNQVRVAFKGFDNETNVTKYVYSLVEQVSGNVVIEATSSTKLDGEFITIAKDHAGNNLALIDGLSYVFNIYAVNGVGSAGAPLISDGFIMDSSKRLAGCNNGVIDENETDVDCGRICGDNCGEGMRCLRDRDCKSNICTGGECVRNSCSDHIFSPYYESDIDCGRSCSRKCRIGDSCIIGSDCLSGTCLGSVCRDELVCSDGILTLNSDETGIDCGGSCPAGCSSGEGCLIDSDCEDGLSCGEDNLCRGVEDEDGDGVPDAVDQCSKTPNDESVDSMGCGLSQKDSDDDGMSDAFELKYGLDINDPADASLDNDKDGLTNLEEFKIGTDPVLPDTDGDKWRDGDEVEKGTDPKNPLSRPASIVIVLMKMFLVLLLLVIFAIIGYVLYDRFLKGGLPKFGAGRPLFKQRYKPSYKPVIKMPEFKPFFKRESPEYEKVEKNEEENAFGRLKDILKGKEGKYKKEKNKSAIERLKRLKK